MHCKTKARLFDDFNLKKCLQFTDVARQCLCCERFFWMVGAKLVLWQSSAS